jgi:hypothetical protein
LHPFSIFNQYFNNFHIFFFPQYFNCFIVCWMLLNLLRRWSR